MQAEAGRTSAEEHGPPRDLTHLLPEVRDVLDAEVDERVTHALKDHWLGYPAAAAALAAMGDLLRRPRTTTSPSLLLLGRAGNGKTTILERFAAMHPTTTRASGDLTASVIRMTIPPGASETEFWSELLYACAVPHRVTDPILVKKNQAYSVLDTLQPRVLIADELNNLLLGSGTAQRMLMARVRELTNRLRIHLVFAGTEDARNAVNTDIQLNRRLERFELPKWTFDTGFRRLLKSFERVMPLPAASGLSDPEMASEIMARCDGTIGSVARIVKEATTSAIRGGKEKVDIDIIRSIRVETPEERERRERFL